MFRGSRPRPVREGDLTANYKPPVWPMWDPRHLITLEASTACYGDKKNKLCDF
jgi:hypothetical protein